MAVPKIIKNETRYNPKEHKGSGGKFLNSIPLMPYGGGQASGFTPADQKNVPEELAGWIKRIKVEFGNPSVTNVKMGYGGASGVEDNSSIVLLSDVRTASVKREPGANSPYAEFTFRNLQESNQYFLPKAKYTESDSGAAAFRGLCFGFGADRPYNLYVSFEFDFTADLVSKLAFESFDPVKKELVLNIIFKTDIESLPPETKVHYDNVYHYIEYTSGTGAKLTAEGEGRKITIRNFDSNIDFSKGLKLEIWRHVKEIHAPIQTIENIKGLEDKTVKINALEPSGVVVSTENSFTASWSSVNQKRFSLSVNGTSYEGTTETSIQIPQGIATKGTNNITLEIFGDLGADKKTVQFIGRGRPEAPRFDEQSIYSTSKPTFNWITDDQHSYIFKIYKGPELIKDSGTVVSGVKSYTSPVNLQNNTEYTIKVKVKDDRGLWSEEAVKTIRISYSALQPATVVLYANNRGAVTVNVSNPSNPQFRDCEVWRKRSYDTEWTRIAKEGPLVTAFTDQLLAANTVYQYKAISYNKQGGAVESAIQSTMIEVPEMEFIDLSTMGRIPSGYAESPDEPFSRQRVQDRQLMRFQGMQAPVLEIGEMDYNILTFHLMFKEYRDFKAFELHADRAKLILFRSTRGHLFFGKITDWGNEKISATGITSIDFTFTEMEFVPSEIYVAGQQVGIVLTDQGYTFGG